MANVTTNLTLSDSIIRWSKPPDTVTRLLPVPRGRVSVYTENYGEEVTGAGAGDTDRIVGTYQLPPNYVYKPNVISLTVTSTDAAAVDGMWQPAIRLVGITGPQDQGTASFVSGHAQQFAMRPTQPIYTGDNTEFMFRSNLPTTVSGRSFDMPLASNFFLREFYTSSFGTGTNSPAGFSLEFQSDTAPGGTWYVGVYADFLIFDVDQSFEAGLNSPTLII